MTDKEKTRKALWYAQRVREYGRHVLVDSHNKGRMANWGYCIIELGEKLEHILKS